MSSSPRRRISRRAIVITAISAGAVLVLGAIAVVGVFITQGVHAVLAQPPAVGTTVIAPEQSKARVALDHIDMAADATAATQYLAAQPTAYWLTPEQDPIGTVGGTVLSLIAQGRDQGRATAMVVYGLPDRDCGNHSAGGLSPEDYPRWVREIGKALKTAPDEQKIVVLEPDSIALTSECGDIPTRAKYLSDAVDALSSTGTWIYIDGGHSAWHSADEMADLIGQMGIIDRVRGVATNVSNYQSTYDEFAYAHALSARLGGTHAVIDTSRNGLATAGATWCNPSGQRVGDPGGTFGDDVVDTNLWIKPPGESDGTCNGGPDAGRWWPQAAEELTRDVR
ncbi:MULTISPECIES: glycoside hydrolase family 6 protein [Microbacterium]|uniref:Glucanase n=1 Tax=Microbacterium hominis TaxID=162426 RepID=A0A2K9DXR0_9MICO|nr:MULTISPECIES: glycoside hydrolase family 6 protein [Microbacterium]AUG30664.1 cellobiohydrolase [Microbacterium hominis]QOC26417.1 glycoside hydrolase family 6 protein [Microbacterium hominis]QOC27596.1 glycoside hydrolase family 6 protein [Microbacterium hominis]QYF97275.1 glycoside hydrolase family 6 protein [Microbacterium sp. PAMC21962]